MTKREIVKTGVIEVKYAIYRYPNLLGLAQDAYEWSTSNGEESDALFGSEAVALEDVKGRY